MGDSTKHKNDPYGAVTGPGADDSDAPPPIPAATVILLRDDPAGDGSGLSVLMLRKTSKISFGGMWVFPGGKIDAADYPKQPPDLADVDAAARTAAVRETREEAALELAADDFVEFSHWTPPTTTPKRFSTWFFVARGDKSKVIVDGGEIDDHKWINPQQALEQHAQGEIDLVPPTWVSLYQLTKYDTVEAALAGSAAQNTRRYVTRLAKRADGVRVTLWEGDAGYGEWSADVDGPTHRLSMEKGGFVFEHSAAAY